MPCVAMTTAGPAGAASSARSRLLEAWFPDPAFYVYRSKRTQMIMNFCQMWNIVCKVSAGHPPPVTGPALASVSLLFYGETLPRSESQKPQEERLPKRGAGGWSPSSPLHEIGPLLSVKTFNILLGSKCIYTFVSYRCVFSR